jgi:hypothetical protein
MEQEEQKELDINDEPAEALSNVNRPQQGAEAETLLPPSQFDKFEKEVEEEIKRKRKEKKRPGRPPSKNRMIIYRYFDREYRYGVDERGVALGNDVEIQLFEGENLNYFPPYVRPAITNVVNRIRSERPRAGTDIKLNASQIQEIIDILRRS